MENKSQDSVILETLEEDPIVSEIILDQEPAIKIRKLNLGIYFYKYYIINLYQI